MPELILSSVEQSDPYTPLLLKTPAIATGDLPAYNKAQFLDRFNEAAHGVDVLDKYPALADDMVGRPTHVYRSDITKANVELANNVAELTRYSNRQIHGYANADEKSAADAALKKLSADSGIPEKDLQKSIEEMQDDIVYSWAQPSPLLTSMFGQENGSPTSLSRKIGTEIIQGFTAGVDNHAELARDLATYNRLNKLSPLAAQQTVDQFKTLVGEADGSFIRNNLTALTASARNAPGESVSGFGRNANIIVAKNNDSLFLDPKDLPPGQSPLSLEQVSYLIALHEAAHAKDAVAIATVAPTKISAEIRGDLNVIRALNDTGDQHLKDYYLQSRNVSTFRNQVIASVWADPHDTATFIRELEKTNRQIDMNMFRDEKSGLTNKVYGRLLGLDPKTGEFKEISPTTANIMAATADALAKEKLTPVQKAIAEDYLQDAKNLGYIANPDFVPLSMQSPKTPRVSLLSPNTGGMTFANKL